MNYLEMVDIKKTFPNGVRALRGANLSVEKGKIHALVGENAAGKSTLMNVLYGVISADSGSIYLNGNKINIRNSADAISHGIGMVHQHFKLVPDFTILENIILGSEKKYTNSIGKIDYAKARIDVEKILQRINVELDLDAQTNSITIGLQSKVEIIKALFRGAELLILDEPTTVLAPNEVDAFFDFLRALRDSGCTMIYISHRLKEIFALTDNITVLRHGQNVATVATKDVNMEELSTAMLGREVKSDELNSVPIKVQGEKMVEIENLCAGLGYSQIQNINLTINSGEIVGIAGIEGNGQVELADSLAGLIPISAGCFVLDGQDVSEKLSGERRTLGLSYVPDDRIKKGLALNAKITENSIIGHYGEDFIKDRFGMIDWGKVKTFANEISDEYKVEGLSTPEQKIASLSGGNMQKVIVGRELIKGPRFTILSQPTAGVDFNAQHIIHDHVRDLQKKGCACLLISEDLDELMALSNRIVVLYKGRTVKEFCYEDGYDAQTIGYYMTGVKSNE